VSRSSSPAESRSHWPPTFRTGWWPAVTLVLGFAGWVLVSVTLSSWLFGDSITTVEEGIWTIPSGMVQIGIAVAILRYERVGYRELGLAPRLLAPALVATGVVVLVVNAAVAGLGIFAGGDLSFSLMGYYLSPPLDYSVPGVIISAVSLYLFTATAEELAFRGYLQNKIVSRLTVGSATVQTSIGVLVAALSFAVLHVPVYMLVRDVSTGAMTGTLLLLTATGALFGVIYAATRNLYLVIGLHGIGNLWPLVVDPGMRVWPNYGVILLVYVLLVLAYRTVVEDLPTPLLLQWVKN
jgi:membrane protease YdiL (CAAX protease family)